MQELNLRLGQAVALTYAQTDDNFKRLKTAIDALENAVATGGNGTVTTVGLVLPNIFTVTNSPVTSAGTLTATLASQSANRLFASPNGSAGAPTFRSLVAADLPTVPINKGGLNLTTVATNNQVLASNGTGYEGRTISVSGGLTLTNGAGSIALGFNPAVVNITGFAGVLTVAKGGTGLSTPPANGALLIGNGTSYASATLTAGSGISITNGVGTVTIANTATGVSQLNGFTGSLNLSVDTLNNDVQITNISPDIILSIPTASATKRGALSSADWTTFNSKVGGSGTTNYIPKFTASGTVGDSVLFDTGARIGLNTATPSYELDVFPLTGGGADSTLRVRTNTVGFRANLRLEDGTNTTTFTSLGVLMSNAPVIVQSNLRIFPTGNVQASKGFAVNGWAYWNVPGTYTFASNELYGVVLGTASDNTMTVVLPASPMDGQEICILCEENKTLTITSSKTIFGHTGGTNINIAITGGGAGSAALMVKYAAGAGPTSVGAWFITGL